MPADPPQGREFKTRPSAAPTCSMGVPRGDKGRCSASGNVAAAPPVSLIEDAVALGRGVSPPFDALQALLGASHHSAAEPPRVQWLGSEDDRVSRLHATLAVQWEAGRCPPLVTIEDHSRNGTFLNGVPLPPGRPIVLSNGDRISLVLSVNPLAEVTYKYEEAVPHPAAGAAAAVRGRNHLPRVAPAGGLAGPWSLPVPVVGSPRQRAAAPARTMSYNGGRTAVRRGDATASSGAATTGAESFSDSNGGGGSPLSPPAPAASAAAAAESACSRQHAPPPRSPDRRRLSRGLSEGSAYGTRATSVPLELEPGHEQDGTAAGGWRSDGPVAEELAGWQPSYRSNSPGLDRVRPRSEGSRQAANCSSRPAQQAASLAAPALRRNSSSSSSARATSTGSRDRPRPLSRLLRVTTPTSLPYPLPCDDMLLTFSDFGDVAAAVAAGAREARAEASAPRRSSACASPRAPRLGGADACESPRAAAPNAVRGNAFRDATGFGCAGAASTGHVHHALVPGGGAGGAPRDGLLSSPRGSAGSAPAAFATLDSCGDGSSPLPTELRLRARNSNRRRALCGERWETPLASSRASSTETTPRVLEASPPPPPAEWARPLALALGREGAAGAAAADAEAFWARLETQALGPLGTGPGEEGDWRRGQQEQQLSSRGSCAGESHDGIGGGGAHGATMGTAPVRQHAPGVGDGLPYTPRSLLRHLDERLGGSQRQRLAAAMANDAAAATAAVARGFGGFDSGGSSRMSSGPASHDGDGAGCGWARGWGGSRCGGCDDCGGGSGSEAWMDAGGDVRGCSAAEASPRAAAGPTAAPRWRSVLEDEEEDAPSFSRLLKPPPLQHLAQACGRTPPPPPCDDPQRSAAAWGGGDAWGAPRASTGGGSNDSNEPDCFAELVLRPYPQPPSVHDTVVRRPSASDSVLYDGAMRPPTSSCGGASDYEPAADAGACCAGVVSAAAAAARCEAEARGKAPARPPGLTALLLPPSREASWGEPTVPAGAEEAGAEGGAGGPAARVAATASRSSSEALTSKRGEEVAVTARSVMADRATEGPAGQENASTHVIARGEGGVASKHGISKVGRGVVDKFNAARHNTAIMSALGHPGLAQLVAREEDERKRRRARMRGLLLGRRAATATTTKSHNNSFSEGGVEDRGNSRYGGGGEYDNGYGGRYGSEAGNAADGSEQHYQLPRELRAPPGEQRRPTHGVGGGASGGAADRSPIRGAPAAAHAPLSYAAAAAAPRHAASPSPFHTAGAAAAAAVLGTSAAAPGREGRGGSDPGPLHAAAYTTSPAASAAAARAPPPRQLGPFAAAGGGGGAAAAAPTSSAPPAPRSGYGGYGGSASQEATQQQHPGYGSPTSNLSTVPSFSPRSSGYGRRSPGGSCDGGAGGEARAEAPEEGEGMGGMSALCPLHDEYLPLPAVRLHVRQAEEMLMRLRGLLEVVGAADGGEGPAAGRWQSAAARARCEELLSPLARLSREYPEVAETLSAMGAAQGYLIAIKWLMQPLQQQLQQGQQQQQQHHAPPGEHPSSASGSAADAAAGGDAAAQAHTCGEAEATGRAAEAPRSGGGEGGVEGAALEHEAGAWAAAGEALVVLRAACAALAPLLQLAPPPVGGPDGHDPRQQEALQHMRVGNQWAVARLGGAELLLRLLRHAAEAAGQRGEEAAGGGRGGKGAVAGELLGVAALTSLRLLVANNLMTQAHVASEGMDAVLHVLRTMPYSTAVQVTGLQLLAEVARGSDPAHAAVRQRLVEAGGARAAAEALHAALHGRPGCAEGERELLSAGAELLEALLEEPVSHGARKAAASELRRLRVLPLLGRCLDAVEAAEREEGVEWAGAHSWRHGAAGVAAPDPLLAARRRLEGRLQGLVGPARRQHAPAACGGGGPADCCAASDARSIAESDSCCDTEAASATWSNTSSSPAAATCGNAAADADVDASSPYGTAGASSAGASSTAAATAAGSGAGSATCRTTFLRTTTFFFTTRRRGAAAGSGRPWHSARCVSPSWLLATRAAPVAARAKKAARPAELRATSGTGTLGSKDGSTYFFRSATAAEERSEVPAPASRPTAESSAALEKKAAMRDCGVYWRSGPLASKTQLGRLSSICVRPLPWELARRAVRGNLCTEPYERVGATIHTVALVAAAMPSVLISTRSSSSLNLRAGGRESWSDETAAMADSMIIFCTKAGSAMRRPTKSRAHCG
ncbi:hypothetical protein TSOC_006795 [Tetrabaena socialis]|uniref:FHA domain-containing protein n=1 Tax=Tetrabaena socialis TaxID=47790 RepID=A0A2J8A2R7_9CHLO|nr:hypothetical protein TSOC_006795 [Tetrabaena socialis]|eukprot:PNH06810.1 hypothetical protein TSOC_006795 [Tetrabaena socialis]